MREFLNIVLVAVLLLVLRKLSWCIRWLWAYYHQRPVPDPISFLPVRSGEGFDRHVQRASGAEDEKEKT